MKKFFGTDGIRNKVFSDILNPETAYLVGRAAAHILSKKNKSKVVFIGKDTRISGDMLEASLASGLSAQGLNVISLGIVPTPVVAYLTRSENALFGIVISASHNPWFDNGIKFFSNSGLKLSKKEENDIEEILNSPDNLKFSEIPGNIYYDNSYVDKYINEMSNILDQNSLKVIVDCANGATYKLAKKIFDNAQINAEYIFNEPDGININKNCGSTDLTELSKKVIERQANIGIAFDGDGDRVLFVDEKGESVDGDQIISICVNEMIKNKTLKNNSVVVTVMSNFGFFEYMKKLNCNAITTDVGDKHVVAEMFKTDTIIGGEQSGHIIFKEHNTTGDGILTATKFMNYISKLKKPLSELKSIMNKYPQILKNIKVKDKNKWKHDIEIQKIIKKSEETIKDNGRILIRPSGTEPLIRIMAEGKDKKMIKEITENIADKFKSLEKL